MEIPLELQAEMMRKKNKQVTLIKFLQLVHRVEELEKRLDAIDGKKTKKTMIEEAI